MGTIPAGVLNAVVANPVVPLKELLRSNIPMHVPIVQIRILCPLNMPHIPNARTGITWMPFNPAPFTPIFAEINEPLSPCVISNPNPHLVLVSEWGEVLKCAARLHLDVQCLT